MQLSGLPSITVRARGAGRRRPQDFLLAAPLFFRTAVRPPPRLMNIQGCWPRPAPIVRASEAITRRLMFGRIAPSRSRKLTPIPQLPCRLVNQPIHVTEPRSFRYSQHFRRISTARLPHVCNSNKPLARTCSITSRPFSNTILMLRASKAGASESSPHGVEPPSPISIVDSRPASSPIVQGRGGMRFLRNS
jgi:hypothetical protein